MEKEILDKLKQDVLEHRNEIGFCPVCGANIKDRTVSLYKGLINTLYGVYCWCGEKRRHEFERKEVNHLINKVDYTRFGDLIRFGGIVYKPEGKEKAHFGINMARAKAFFKGEYKIPMQITLNQITNEIIEATYVTIFDFPDLLKFINEKGLYDHEKIIEPREIDWERQNKAGLKPVGEQSRLFPNKGRL